MSEFATPVTLVVIVVTTLLSIYAFGNAAFLRRRLFATGPILERRQWDRLVSSGFLHGGYAHLFFNMYTLWSFGRVLEFVHGPWAFLVIYFAAIVGGNLVSLWLHRHEPHYRALGASGGVSGVIFAVIFLFPQGDIQLMLIPIPIPSWLFAIGFVVGSYLALRGRVGNIGHDAHLGGALCGLAAAVALFPDLPLRRPLLFVAVVVITVGLLWHAKTYPLRPAGQGWTLRGRTGGAAGGGQGGHDQGGHEHGGHDHADHDRARLDELLARSQEVGLAGLSDGERAELKDIADRRRR